MPRPTDVVSRIIEHDALAAVADLVADRFLDLQLAARIEPELDPVFNLAGDPTAFGHPSDRREAHARRFADFAQDGVQPPVAAQRDRFGV